VVVVMAVENGQLIPYLHHTNLWLKEAPSPVTTISSRESSKKASFSFPSVWAWNDFLPADRSYSLEKSSHRIQYHQTFVSFDVFSSSWLHWTDWRYPFVYLVSRQVETTISPTKIGPKDDDPYVGATMKKMVCCWP
jgi:hypothetical protein